MTKRCINLDWLEVHCLEPVGEPRDAAFFRRIGLVVNERDYGTRVYKEMFTVCLQNDTPFVEVRRNPMSQGWQGIHAAEECHLRLVNAACYYDNAAQLLQQFMASYGYQFQRVSRVDICLDFEFFDRGDDPQKFIMRYFRQVYAKINQGNISSHGADRWDGQTWNSVSWGASSSPIGTKFYNKTLELYDPKSNTYGKPHIRYAWLLAGLVDDFHNVTKRKPDGSTYTPQIWRVEFSVRSSVKNWMTIELNGKRRAYQSLRNTLECYDTRAKLLTIFASLANHYFHFKYVRYKEPKAQPITAYALNAHVLDDTHTLVTHVERQRVRKDRCPDKVLFDFSGEQVTYKVGRNDVPKILGDGRHLQKPLDSLIAKIRAYRDSHFAPDITEACNVLIRAMEGDILRSDMANPWSLTELRTLQLVLKQNIETGDSTKVAVLMREIKELLKINDLTAIF